MTDRGVVLLLDDDLFFVVRVTDTLKHAGYATRAARREDEFARALAEARPAAALVNTAARGIDFRRAIGLARATGVPVVAFGPHVDRQTQDEARRAGAARVISNARLSADLPGVLERALRGGPAAEAPADDDADGAAPQDEGAE